LSEQTVSATAQSKPPKQKFEFPSAVTTLAIVTVLVWMGALFIPAGQYAADAVDMRPLVQELLSQRPEVRNPTMKPGIEPVLKQSGDDLQQRAVIANVCYNAQRLQHAKPILAEMIAKNEIRVVGAVYDLTTGKVTLA